MGAAGAMIVAQVGGSLLRAHAEGQAADANAATLETNAHLADMTAADAVSRGGYSASIRRLKGGRDAAQQQGAYAAAGVDVSSGSALDAVADTSAIADLDARTIQANAEREAWGYRTQASQFRKKAQLVREEAKYGQVASMLGAVGGAVKYGADGFKPTITAGSPLGGTGASAAGDYQMYDGSVS